jgi:GNAT superfamily N-acetyltransferase
MQIETARVPSPLLVEYAAIPIAFEVTSVLSARDVADQRFVLTESYFESPYVKNYDALGDGPLQWARRFDTSQWALLLARAEGRSLGGATVAFGSSQLDMLEGRSDLAVLWDIRVAPDARRQGVGRALFEAAERWALTRGCRELKVETQNVNVPACRFYAALECQLRVVRAEAYPPCPGESQYLWYKTLRDSLAEAG